MVLDIEESTGKIEQQFIPFASRNLYAIPVDITGCGTTMDILQRMQEQERKAGHSSRSLIKFELTGKVDVQSEKELDFLEAQFADSYYFVRVKDSSVYQVDYSQYELDMSLKGEFIRTVRGRTDICEEDKAAIIHYGIQALAGEEIIEE